MLYHVAIYHYPSFLSVRRKQNLGRIRGLVPRVLTNCAKPLRLCDLRDKFANRVDGRLVVI